MSEMAAAFSSAKSNHWPIPSNSSSMFNWRHTEVNVCQPCDGAGGVLADRKAVVFTSFTLPRSRVGSVPVTRLRWIASSACTLLNSRLIQNLQPKCTWNTSSWSSTLVHLFSEGMYKLIATYSKCQKNLQTRAFVNDLVFWWMSSVMLV